MCEPTTIAAVVSIAATAAGAGIAAFGQKKQATAQNASIDYNAQIMENNAKISEIKAQDEIDQGEQEVSDLQERLSLVKGSQRASFAGAGVLVDTGSPLDVLDDTQAQGDLDAMTLRGNASRRAWGHNVNAYNQRGQANINRRSKTSGNIGVASTLLSGAGRVASQYGAAKNQGIF